MSSNAGKPINLVFVVHDDFGLAREVLLHNLATLRDPCLRDVRVTVLVDRWDTAPLVDWFTLAARAEVDQVLCSNARAKTARGHASNNGHMHVPHGAASVTVSIEGDVAVFASGPYSDPLSQIVDTLDSSSCSVLFRVDDHEQWATPLALGSPLVPGVRRTNRLASHFLVYDDARFNDDLVRLGGVPWGSFYEDPIAEQYFNYEDWLGRELNATGDRIGFLEDPGVAVFHCDKKQALGSEFYTGDVETKLSVFHDLLNDGRR